MAKRIVVTVRLPKTEPYDAERERQEAACDAAQEVADAEIRAKVGTLTQAELEAAQMREFERNELLKHVPSRRWLDKEDQ